MVLCELCQTNEALPEGTRCTRCAELESRVTTDLRLTARVLSGLKQNVATPVYDKRIVERAKAEALRVMRVTVIGEFNSLTDYILAIESNKIEEALRISDGHITGAADILGESYQSLAYIVASRHKNLGSLRRAVVKRSKSNGNGGG